MTIVRVRNEYEFLDKTFSEIVDLVKQNISFIIRARSYHNADYIVKTLFENYIVRSKYLGRKLNDYYLLNFGANISNYEEMDTELIKYFSYLVGIEFINFQSILRYLEDQDKYIVLYANIDAKQEIARYLLSYSFILKNRIIFIFSSDHDIDLIEKKVYVEFSNAFLNFYIKKKLFEMNAKDVDIEEVINQCQGDLGKVYKSIYISITQKNNLNDKVSLSHPYSTYLDLSTENKNLNNSDTVNKNKSENKDYSRLEKITKETTKDILTPREKAILETLKEKRFITRSELANIVWGETLGPKASNDAIDQVISRLRRKLVKLGFPKNYIYSKKGQGVGIN